MNKKKPKKRRKVHICDHIVGEHLAKRTRKAAKILREGAEDLDKVRLIYKNCSRDKVAGRCAEVHHKVTRNFDAATKGITSRTRLTKPGSAADLRTGSRLAQVKYRKNALFSAGRAAHRKYAGMDLILPSDQADLAIKKLKRSANFVRKRSPQKAAARLDAAKRIRKTNNVKGAQSRPLTRRGARLLARKGGKLWRKEAAVHEALGVASAHLKSGALSSGVVTGAQELYDVFRNKKCPKKAALSVAKSAAGGGAQSIATHVVSEGVKKTAKKLGAKALLKGNGAAAVAGGMLDIAKHGYDYATGEMDGEEFLKESGKTVIKGGAAYAAAEVGAIAGMAIGGPPGALVVGALAAVAVGFGLDELLSF